MGRPINKRHFAGGKDTQMKVRAFPVGGAEGDGVVVRQKGSKAFIVTVGGVTGLCRLVNKANGALVAGEMTITVADNSAGTHRVTKLTGKKATLGDTSSTTAWSFAAAVAGDDQVALAATITISAQPPLTLAKLTADTNFTIALTASVNGSETLAYQWQSSTDAGKTWNNVSAPYTGGTTATLTVATASGKNGYQYRCLLSSATASATSSVCVLTVS